MTRFNSALDVAAAIQSRQISPVEVLEHYLAQADTFDPTLNAFALRDDERALEQAKAAADLVAHSDPEDLPPFIGVPIPIKDLNDVQGWPTSYGSLGVPDTPAQTDCPQVERFRAAGFVLMAKTTTPEFGTISMTESQRFGATRNPWNPAHTPGGSSGGAAAAVAAGMAPIAHASDGGGSIRIPASCTGLVGLKPSRNRITGRTEKMTAASTSGVVSRTVADTAAVLDVLAVRDSGAWNVAPSPERPFADEVGVNPGKLRIRVATSNPLGIPVDPACAEAASYVADLLSDLGHNVTESSPQWPEASLFAEGFLTVWATIAAGIEGLNTERIEPHNLLNLNKALNTSSIAFTEATMMLQSVSRLLTCQFGADFDVLVTPTMAVEPPLVGSIWEGTEADPNMTLINAMPMAAFTAMFNVTGQPALSLPVHVSESGLPVGVQFIAPPWQEAMLIRLGSQIEAAQPWSDRWPSMVL